MSALPEREQSAPSTEPTAPPAEHDRLLALVDDRVTDKGEQLALFDADEYLGPLRYIPCHQVRDEDHDRARCWLCFGDRHL